MDKKISCFANTLLEEEKCLNKKCVYWYECDKFNNCVINASNTKTHTLQEIGDIFDISRMRVCQIEKKALEKIKKNITI